MLLLLLPLPFSTTVQRLWCVPDSLHPDLSLTGNRHNVGYQSQTAQPPLECECDLQARNISNKVCHSVLEPGVKCSFMGVGTALSAWPVCPQTHRHHIWEGLSIQLSLCCPPSPFEPQLYRCCRDLIWKTTLCPASSKTAIPPDAEA